jgi:hypothetical protein
MYDGFDGIDWEDWMIIGPMSEEIADEKESEKIRREMFEDDDEDEPDEEY